MKEVAISEFKAKCLALLDEVQKTKKPLLVTRFGEPVAEVVPHSPALTGPIFCTKWNVSVTPLLIFVRRSRRGCGDVGKGFCFPHLHAPVLG
jgi:prevent-host-death family protein